MAFLTRHRGFVRARPVRTARMTAFVRAPVTARPWVGASRAPPRPPAWGTTGVARDHTGVITTPTAQEESA